MATARKVPPLVAAKLLGTPVSCVYATMRRFPTLYGVAYKIDPDSKRGKWHYEIYLRKFARAEAISIKEVRDECDKYDALGGVEYKQNNRKVEAA